MIARRWRVVGAVAGLACAAIAIRIAAPAGAGTTPNGGGGGWAHAGAAPGAPYGARAASTTATTYPVQGIDVSSHDHSVYPIDWASVATSGVKFAYVKASEGTFYANPYFAADYQAAKNSGLYAGAYAFGRPDLGNPAGQADYLVDQSLWTADSRTLIPFLDIEWPYSSLNLPSCWGLSTTQMSTWIRAFVTEVQVRIGRAPMIYTNSNWWNPCTGNDASFGAYPLDIAGYTSTPPALPAGWSSFAIWQYAAGANNLPGNYDRDAFNGDLAGLATLAGPTAPTVVSLRAHANNRFVCADAGGQSPLIANRTAVGPWEQFDEVDAGGGYVALRAHANGRYVTAEAGGAAALIANRTAVGPWEMFQLIHNGDGSVSLQARANGRYVTAEAGGASPLIANRTAIGPWEEFTLSG